MLRVVHHAMKLAKDARVCRGRTQKKTDNKNQGAFAHGEPRRFGKLAIWIFRKLTAVDPCLFPQEAHDRCRSIRYRRPSGGPRSCRERSCDMLRFESVCATPARELTQAARLAPPGGVASTSMCVAATAPGQYGHLAGRALKAEPGCVRPPSCPMLVPQWCLPFLLQQAGKPPSPSAPDASNGETMGRPNIASNRMERSRFTFA